MASQSSIKRCKAVTRQPCVGEHFRIVKADKTMDCAYIGQVGRVLNAVNSDIARVLLRCGHTLDMDLASLEQIETGEMR